MIHSELSSPEERLHLDLDDAHVHMHVCGAFVFDPGPLRLEGGGIDIERIRALVEARLHRVPRMRQRLVETPLDGRPALGEDIALWDGSSRGHWEGDTLVIETAGFDGRNPFIGSTSGLRLVERLRRFDENTIDDVIQETLVELTEVSRQVRLGHRGAA